MRRPGCAFLTLLTLAPLAAAQPPAVPDPSPKGQREVEVTWGVKVPMRDGVRLNATLYRPRGEDKATPAIVTLTPYTADGMHDRAYYFAGHGYAFALVDSRGRGNSGGEFVPFANEGRDGHDLVEWVARQSWCNGKVGMWGGSYGGYNQWATLKELPPHLATIVPVASAHPGVDFPAPGGIVSSYWIRWLTLTAGVTSNQKLFNEDAYWLGVWRKRYLEHIPFRELDTLAGNPSPLYQKWLKHRGPDAYWESMVPQAEHYKKIDLPILTITGYYDGDQPGAMEFYKRHARHGTAKGFGRHYLVIGPWDHAGTRTPQPQVGGVRFGQRSALAMNSLHKEWYDWTLKGSAPPEFLDNRVTYYVAGKDRWRFADGLNAIPAKPRKLYLRSAGNGAADVFRSGLLSEEPPGKEAPDRYVYDPLDTRPAELEKEKIKDHLTDQRPVLNLFGNGLVYHSEPFERATEVSGRFRLVAWVSMNVPDTDFQAHVYEVLQDGTSILLADDRLRARYRESFATERFAKPGEVNRYELSAYFWVSRELAKGSRLRLVFRSPNSVHLEKNYNSGRPVGTETRADARTAHVSLHHDAEHPSYLEIPVVGKAE